MAPSPSTPFFVVLPLLVLLHSCSSRVYGDHDLHGFGVVRAEDFVHGSVCSESKVPSGNSLKLVHRYGPCSPSAVSLPNGEEIFGQDSQRAAYLQSQVNLTNTGGNKSMDALHASLETTSLPLLSGRTLYSSGYIVTIDLGTPTRTQTVLIDTGSNVCWVQCEPCRKCYDQREPKFEPATSSSYRNVTFNALPCTSLPHGFRSSTGNTCIYHVAYADSSSTTGFLATETLRLGQTGNVVDNFVFGCGHINAGPNLRGFAGIFGLGRGFHSLVSQTSGHLGNAFSYCLPTVDSGVGHLTLGRRMAPPPIHTPMIPGPRSLYYVELLGISVARQRLSLSPAIFGSIGAIIDSGTIISRLPPIAYTALRTAFRNGMVRYRQAPPVRLLDTCYSITTKDFPSPEIMLHFRGADITLKFPQVFFAPTASIFCLAFTPTTSGEHGAIIGAIQQRGTEVIYDIGNSRIGFLPESHC